MADYGITGSYQTWEPYYGTGTTWVTTTDTTTYIRTGPTYVVTIQAYVAELVEAGKASGITVYAEWTGNLVLIVTEKDQILNWGYHTFIEKLTTTQVATHVMNVYKHRKFRRMGELFANLDEAMMGSDFSNLVRRLKTRML